MLPVTLSPNGLDRYRLSEPPEHLLVATVDGIVELQRIGDRWNEIDRALAGVHASALLADNARDTVYAASHGDGVFRRRGRRGWYDASEGIGSRNVFSLALAEVDGAATLYAGTEPAMLFASSDGGETWDELEALRSIPDRDTWNFPVKPFIAHAKHVDFDPRDARTFYLSIEQGALLKTTDGGRSFIELPFHDASYIFNKDCHRLVINPHDPDELYLPGGDGIAHSRDGGRTWQRLTTPEMRVAYPDAMFCSPQTDGVVYVAGAGARPGSWRKTGTADAAFMRSRDHGATWELLSLPELRGNIEAVTLVEWPDGYGFLAGTTDGEVFASMDRGETWTAIATGLPALSKCIHAANLVVGRGVAERQAS